MWRISSNSWFSFCSRKKLQVFDAVMFHLQFPSLFTFGSYDRENQGKVYHLAKNTNIVIDVWFKKAVKMDALKGMSHVAGLGMLIFLYHSIILFIWTLSELDYFLSFNSKVRGTENRTRSLTDWVHTFITKIWKLKLLDVEMGHQQKHGYSFSQWDLKTLRALKTERILFHTSLTVLSNILLSKY